MGLVYAEVTLSNPVAPEGQAPVAARALVDSGSTFLVIPQHIANQLRIGTHEEREVTLADGAKKLVPYAGPVQVEVLGRRAFVGALVMGDEVLLGVIPMEDMDLVVHPLHRRLGPNPLNPNVPGAMAKGSRSGKPSQHHDLGSRGSRTDA
jgi:clan AA aspartic protease